MTVGLADMPGSHRSDQVPAAGKDRPKLRAAYTPGLNKTLTIVNLLEAVFQPQSEPSDERFLAKQAPN
jgi:hypothetical protein